MRGQGVGGACRVGGRVPQDRLELGEQRAHDGILTRRAQARTTLLPPACLAAYIASSALDMRSSGVAALSGYAAIPTEIVGSAGPRRCAVIDGAHAMGDALGDVSVTVDDDRELVAADAEDVVRRTDGGERPPRDLAEHLVARLVTRAVVDGLQPVEIEEGERRRPARPAEHQLQPLVERTTVAGAGERIAARLRQRGLRPAQARHRDRRQVGDGGEHALGPGRRLRGHADEQDAEPVVPDRQRQGHLPRAVAPCDGALERTAPEGLGGELRMPAARRLRTAPALETELPVLADEIGRGEGDVAHVCERVGDAGGHLGRLRRVR